jgi:hypothetical protein
MINILPKDLNPFSILVSQLWGNVQGLFLLAFVVAIISCLLIQAIKKADDTIFLKEQLSKNALFLLNILITFLITIIITITMAEQKTLFLTIVFAVVLWLFSWGLSVIFYDYFLKYLFLAFDIIEGKLKNIKVKLKSDTPPLIDTPIEDPATKQIIGDNNESITENKK